MKNIIFSVLAVIVPYLIFIMNWKLDVKILAVSTLCLILLSFYILKAGGWRTLSSGSKAIAAPTCILFAFALLNFSLDLKFSVLSVWGGFIVLTIVSFVLAEFFSKE